MIVCLLDIYYLPRNSVLFSSKSPCMFCVFTWLFFVVVRTSACTSLMQLVRLRSWQAPCGISTVYSITKLPALKKIRKMIHLLSPYKKFFCVTRVEWKRMLHANFLTFEVFRSHDNQLFSTLGGCTKFPTSKDENECTFAQSKEYHVLFEMHILTFYSHLWFQTYSLVV